MPIAAATDWITLESLATHLSLDYDSGNTEQVAELTGILQASIALVEQAVHHPVLDQEFRVLVRRPGDFSPYNFLPYYNGFPLRYEVAQASDEAPVEVPVRGVRGAMVFRYWLPSQNLSEAPTGSVTPGRVDAGEYMVPQGTASASILTHLPKVYPPADGWPQALDRSPFVITGNAGFNAVADIPPPWRIAVLHFSSSFYETQKETAPFVMNARRCLAPWAYRGVSR